MLFNRRNFLLSSLGVAAFLPSRREEDIVVFVNKSNQIIIKSNLPIIYVSINNVANFSSLSDWTMFSKDMKVFVGDSYIFEYWMEISPRTLVIENSKYVYLVKSINDKFVISTIETKFLAIDPK